MEKYLILIIIIFIIYTFLNCKVENFADVPDVNNMTDIDAIKSLILIAHKLQTQDQFEIKGDLMVYDDLIIGDTIFSYNGENKIKGNTKVNGILTVSNGVKIKSPNGTDYIELGTSAKNTIRGDTEFTGNITTSDKLTVKNMICLGGTCLTEEDFKKYKNA